MKPAETRARAPVRRFWVEVSLGRTEEEEEEEVLLALLVVGLRTPVASVLLAL